MAVQIITVPKLLKVNGFTFNLNNLVAVYVDSIPNPDELVLTFTGGFEKRFQMNGAEAGKLVAWSQNNSLIEVLP